MAGPRRRTARDYHQQGWELSEAGRHAQALEAFRSARALDRTLSYVQYKIALELLQLGRGAEALAEADTVIEMTPDDPAPRMLRAAALFDLARYPEALDTLTALLERQPDSGQVYFDRAQVLRRRGRHPAAVADFDQALRLVPGLAAASEQKAVTLALAGQYDDALAQFAPGDGEPSGRADAWTAAIAWHQGKAEQGRRHFERAAVKPLEANPWEQANLRAAVSCALGRTDAADQLRQAASGPDPAVADVVGGLYALLSDPPLPGIGPLRATALGR